jgi:hypothetical protein
MIKSDLGNAAFLNPMALVNELELFLYLIKFFNMMVSRDLPGILKLMQNYKWEEGIKQNKKKHRN